MAALQFKYSSDQPHQTQAVDAVCDLFRGQEFMAREFIAESYEMFGTEQTTVGHANGLRVSEMQLEQNLHKVQEDNSLPPTADVTAGRLRDFTIEMETGTGKTYVYTRTIYELHKRYGLTKFIIVVPSVAIREGVKKSLDSTLAHFQELYDNTPLDYFVYDSKDMGRINNFATSSAIQVMIINIAAFNKELDKDEKAGVANIFHRPSEKLIGGLSAQELVSGCNPIVIIDEPQSVDNTTKAKNAINSLNPLFILRYSATHKQMLNMLYQLGPVEAFQEGLVKGIVVDSVQSEDDLNGAYVRLDSTDHKSGYTAKITLDVRQADGTQKRKALKVKTGDDLYAKSKENSDYEDGWVVNNIGTDEGDQFIEFQNGTYLELGEVVGDVAAEKVKRAQIARTIEDHLERQLKLYPLGIKVLSLFFIDKVERYRKYEPEVHNGEYADIFEEEYARLATSAKWQRRYEKAGVPLPTDARPLHQGYFAQDKKGKFKDSREGASSADDTSAFELIMRKKETLVSLPDGEDKDKDVAFIFSHSALKEGWDNPNVFQICTLVETNDPLTKRQKIGRGLRLPVNQKGERSYDPDVNVLTVISNESYKEFADGLQKEFEDGGFKFGTLTAATFSDVVMVHENGNEEKLGYARSAEIYEGFKAAGMVSVKGEITQQLKEAAQTGDVHLPEELAAHEEVVQDVCTIIMRKAERLPIRNKKTEVTVELQKDVTADPAFQALWERIRQTTRYEMTIDTEELVKNAVDGVKRMSRVQPVQVVSSKAELSVDETGVGVVEDTVRETLVNTENVRVYDLPDPLSELQDAVGLTRATIKRILEESGRMDEFSIDPMTFLKQVGAKINEAKLREMSKGIKYTKLPESKWYTMDILAVDDLTAYLGQNAWEPTSGKSIYNYVVYDSTTIEQPYAMALDRSENVKVFAKLPDAFRIDTPLGWYNPDWAYVEEVDGRERVYFVVETKGRPRGENRPSEEAKIDCAEAHFAALGLGDDFVYEVETTYRFHAGGAKGTGFEYAVEGM